MTTPLFPTVLVANRGEIARRVIRSLRRLGIRSVAIYSDADADAPHVREADEAVHVGAASAADSYLRVDAIIDAALMTGARAIHPGYGFLSESAELARACAENGVVFIGPGTAAIEIMGDKARARAHVASRGVPVVPGFDAADLSDEEIARAADEVGYPLLVKPSAGGGGKGMEVVTDASRLTAALASARRVARAAFGDDALVIERLIRRPRHIEVQVFGDAAGTVIALGERECTLQRRHQKVIEEAPSAGISEETRQQLFASAVRAAGSVSYIGAGTVEFLIDADAPTEIFFIEMNTRLQVEHPVTEEVTGLDLVELQVRVAAGLALPGVPEVHGHAVEARVYAESPERGFLPSTGTVLLFELSEGVRVDAAIETGSSITGNYDPMIAKVIAVGPDRQTALARLEDALARTVVLGVDTNIDFLRLLCRDSRVREGDLDTGLIDTLLPLEPTTPSDAMLAAARRALPHRVTPFRSGAPWTADTGWRLSGTSAMPGPVEFLTDDDAVVQAPMMSDPNAGARTAVDDEGAVWVWHAGRSSRLRPFDRRARAERRRADRQHAAEKTDPEARAPMPGSIVVVHVVDGERVSAGAPLVSIEAMKMEHPVLAPHDGVARVLVALGDQVRRGQPVVQVTAEESE